MVVAMAGFSACGEGASTTTSSSNATSGQARQITDDAGRTVTVPAAADLTKVYFTSSTGEIYLDTLAPELAAGRSMDYTASQLKYLPAGVGNLPYLGTISGGKQLNPEAITAAGVQLILDVSSQAIQDSDKTQADDLQSQTGIPVALFDGSMAQISHCYTQLGALLGRESQAATLANYVTSKLVAVQDAVAKVPDDQKVSFYYAEGSAGLQTEPDASMHAQTFLMAGAKNVAADIALGGNKGMSPVDLEQVLKWNPAVIISTDADDGGYGSGMLTNPDWASVQAVKTGRVYVMPSTPCSWCDRPPAVNRILGVQWVCNLLYPQQYQVDMVKEVQDFYSTFYHVTISAADAQSLLGNSYQK
jgi:iron complex transport system substrate-binding protein